MAGIEIIDALINAVINLGHVKGIQSGLIADRPAPDMAANDLYVSTDTGMLFYSNATAWLLIGSGAPVLATASNGLTAVGSDVQLGGNIINEVDINLVNNSSLFRLFDKNGDQLFGVANDAVVVEVGDSTGRAGYVVERDLFQLQVSGVSDTSFLGIDVNSFSYILTNSGLISSIVSDTTNVLIITDHINSAGANYLADYSVNGIASFGDRWITDAGYVNAKIAAIPTITASNGLTKVGSDVQLGGSLIGPTDISISTNQFRVVANFGYGMVITPGSQLELSIGTGPFNVIRFLIDVSQGIGIFDDVLSVGMHYDQNYSVNGIASFGDRWITDAGYVNAQIAAAGPFQPMEDQRLSTGDDVIFDNVTVNGRLIDTFNSAGTNMAGVGNVSGVSVIANNFSNGSGEVDFFSVIGSGGPSVVGGFRWYNVSNDGLTFTLMGQFHGDTGDFEVANKIVIDDIPASVAVNNDFVQIDQTTPGLLVSRTNAQVKSDLGIPTAGPFPSPISVASGILNNFSTTVVLYTFNAPAGNGLYRVNCGMNFTSGAGTITASVTYTGTNAVRTAVTLQTQSALALSNVNTVSIYVAGSTSIVLTVSATGTAHGDVCSTLEFIQ